METRRRWGQLIRRSARTTRRTVRALGDAGQRLAERLAYRPREVVVVALLTAGLFGGVMIERWRAQHAATADWLELEPARPTSATPAQAAMRPRVRSVAARCEEPGGGAVPVSVVGPRLDLNRATPGELARVAGISWRLAARIVAAREAFEGREAPQDAWDGGRTRPGGEPALPDMLGPVTTEAAPDVEGP